MNLPNIKGAGRVTVVRAAALESLSGFGNMAIVNLSLSLV